MAQQQYLRLDAPCPGRLHCCIQSRSVGIVRLGGNGDEVVVVVVGNGNGNLRMMAHGGHRDDFQPRPCHQIELERGVVRGGDQHSLARLGEADAQVLQHGVAAGPDHQALGVQRPGEGQDPPQVVRHGPAERWSARGGLVVDHVGVEGLVVLLLLRGGGCRGKLPHGGDQQVFQHLVLGHRQLQGAVGAGLGTVAVDGPGVGKVHRQQFDGPSAAGAAGSRVGGRW
mmetsp:Transcript_20972/g.60119  ORF Transcript_20972/g.60119 Transcript_20972/m.60119 type:complete len:226 (-) Transcript_20972:473-1150(-)